MDPHFQPVWVCGHLKHHPSISVIGDRSYDLYLVRLQLVMRVSWKTLILWPWVVLTANKSPQMSHELPQQLHLAKLGASYSQQIMPSVMYINSAHRHPRMCALMYISTIMYIPIFLFVNIYLHFQGCNHQLYMYKILNARFHSATRHTPMSPVFTGNPQELTHLLPHYDPEEFSHGGLQKELLSLNSSKILQRISLVWENEFTKKAI